MLYLETSQDNDEIEAFFWVIYLGDLSFILRLSSPLGTTFRLNDKFHDKEISFSLFRITSLGGVVPIKARLLRRYSYFISHSDMQGISAMMLGRKLFAIVRNPQSKRDSLLSWPLRKSVGRRT